MTGPDGALWFVELGDVFGSAGPVAKIGRYVPYGAFVDSFTEFPLPKPVSYPYGIAVGPDNALWFTEVQTNQIGRITSGK